MMLWPKTIKQINKNNDELLDIVEQSGKVHGKSVKTKLLLNILQISFVSWLSNLNSMALFSFAAFERKSWACKCRVVNKKNMEILENL